MNRRIQEKIVKRIINKMGTEQPLTKFERKYFIKFFWTPLRKEVTNIPVTFTEEIYADNELIEVKEDAADHCDRITAGVLNAQTFVVSNSPSFDESIIPRVDTSTIQLTAPERYDDVHENLKESNWQKAKSKVKGWFGK